MGLACAGSSDKDEVVSVFQEMAGIKILDQRFIHRCPGKLKAIQVLSHGETGNTHLIPDRSYFSLRRLSSAEIGKDFIGCMVPPYSLNNCLIVCRSHSKELELSEGRQQFVALHGAPPCGARHIGHNRQSALPLIAVWQEE